MQGGLEMAGFQAATGGDVVQVCLGASPDAPGPPGDLPVEQQVLCTVRNPRVVGAAQTHDVLHTGLFDPAQGVVDGDVGLADNQDAGVLVAGQGLFDDLRNDGGLASAGRALHEQQVLAA